MRNIYINMSILFLGMRKVIKESILAIIDKIMDAIEDNDIFALNKLSNYTIHNASIFQDEDSLSIAIITYSLSKVLDREREIIPSDDQTIIKSFMINLKKMKAALVVEDQRTFRLKVANIFKSIKSLDQKTSDYADEVVNKSKIKKGTVMFQHGISLSQVAETMNISKWDLMGYVGNTSTVDKEKSNIKVIKRWKFTRELFGV